MEDLGRTRAHAALGEGLLTWSGYLPPHNLIGMLLWGGTVDLVRIPPPAIVVDADALRDLTKLSTLCTRVAGAVNNAQIWPSWLLGWRGTVDAVRIPCPQLWFTVADC